MNHLKLLGVVTLLILNQTISFGQEKKADKNFYEQNYRSALDAYNSILADDPDNTRIQYQAELCSLLMKDYRERPLNSILEFANTEGQKDRFYDYWLGRIYMSRYRFEEAVTAFNAFLDLDIYKSPELIDSTRHYISRAENSIKSYNDPKLYELVNMGEDINNSGSQLTAVFFPPTKQLIYTDHTRPDNDITIYITTMQGENEWSKPEVFNSLQPLENDDYDIEFLPPNRLLYKRERAIDIVPYGDNGWGAHEDYIIKLQVKNKNAHFTINTDEDYMIVSEKDFLGHYDLYESTKTEDGWTRPVFIPAVNTTLDEHSPFLSEDSQTLYFSSEGHDALGGHDVFVSKRNGNVWGKPENMGHPINTFDDELYFSISDDGKSGFISSDRLGGNGGFDLYQFKEASFRPIEGVVTNEGTKLPIEGLRLEYQPTKFPSEVFTSYTDKDGKYRSEVVVDDIMQVRIYENEELILSTSLSDAITAGDEPARKDFQVLQVNSEDNVSLAKALTDSENAHYVKEEYADIDFIANEFRPGRKALLKDLYFEYNRSEVSSQSSETLQILLNVLKDHPLVKIEIAGHADFVGSQAFNDELSRKRAMTVYNYLVDNGIDAGRLRATGYGEDNPIASNENEEGRALNRRIEIIVVD